MFFKNHLLFFFVSTIVFVNLSNSVPIENALVTTNNSFTVEESEPAAASFNKNDCLLPPMIGDENRRCRAFFLKYHFDNETKTCKTFVYGGCGGNANRFKTEEECLNACRSP